MGIDIAPQHGEPPLFCAHLQGFSPGGASVPAAGSPPGSGGAGGSPKELKAGGSLSPPPVGKDKSTIILEERAALIDIEEVRGIYIFQSIMLMSVLQTNPACFHTNPAKESKEFRCI